MPFFFQYIFPVFFGLAMVAFFVTFFFVIGKNIRENVKNNHSPRLTIDARVVTKRMQNGYYDGNHRHMSQYYATFEVESGDRMELSMTGEEYGLLAEGDIGKLSFQGTRYLGFVRNGLPDDRVPEENGCLKTSIHPRVNEL